MANDVRLTDLEVIQRYSIAVRGESADRDELLAALRADVAWLERGGARKAAAKAAPAADETPREVTPPQSPATPRPAAPSRKTVAKPAARQAAKPVAKTVAKPAAARKAAAPAKKAARR